MGRRDRKQHGRGDSGLAGDEGARLAALVEELAGDPGYGAGTRRFPRPVATDDAIAITRALERELDEGTAMRAEMALREFHHIACARGCTGCCEEPVVVYLPEAAIVAGWLSRPENRRVRGAFLAAYERWRFAVGEVPEQLAALTERDEDRPAYEAQHRAQWRRRVPCAFLDEGDCTIYPVRPLVCRSANAVGTSARCVAPGPGEAFVPATRLTYRPVDDLLARASSLLRAVHNATSDRPNRSESLCVLVHRLLAGDGD
ncbi:MAG: hypothetical protein EXR72_17475 [Myxococcales bacterium]|nr:hypothetical protein [Myxococcales bacterium]